jgi:REP element-mobilizing transposase RayT
MSRGDRREPIFKDDQDRESLRDLLGQCPDRTGWLVHALCLMPNHFHLVLAPPNPTSWRDVGVPLRGLESVLLERIGHRWDNWPLSIRSRGVGRTVRLR